MKTPLEYPARYHRSFGILPISLDQLLEIRNRLLVAALSAVLFLFELNGVSAATLTVTSTADSGAGSLRQTILDAASGDTITFSLPANSTITLTSAELAINKS